MMTKGMYSSNTYEWATPQHFFDQLNEEFHFTLDVCASDENHKCEKYYTREQDELSKKWGGVVFCNPPYGRQIWKWVKKGSEANATVVMLLPARTDTAWFHDYIYGKAEIRFVRGRIRFNDADNAPFPSMVVVFRGEGEHGLD